jgi:hypothetical protein
MLVLVPVRVLVVPVPLVLELLEAATQHMRAVAKRNKCRT